MGDFSALRFGHFSATNYDLDGHDWGSFCHFLLRMFCCYMNATINIDFVIVNVIIVGPLSRVRPRNGILGLVVVLVVLVLPLRSEFIGEL